MHLDVMSPAGLLPKGGAKDKAVLVIDTLRATTTIAVALAAGCPKVIPASGVAEARKLAQAAGEAILGGERRGVRISGFQLGNSPLEYTHERIARRPVVLATSNGTKAIRRASESPCLATAALVNARAAACWACGSAEDVLLLAAGAKGRASKEDVVTAGAVVAEMEVLGKDLVLSDGAQIALAVFRQCQDDLLGALRAGQHGRRLLELGFAVDLEACSRLNVLNLVPVWREGGLVVWEGPG